jgi:6-phosphogluconolactonase
MPIAAAAFHEGLFAKTAPASKRIYIGTQTEAQKGVAPAAPSKGIYTAGWNPATGEISAIELAAEDANPTFLALRPGHPVTSLYASSELGPSDSKVTQFAVAGARGALSQHSVQSAEGGETCFVSVHPDGNSLYAANYAGSLTSYRLAHDGSLSPPVSHFDFVGSGPDKARQATAHGHSALIAPGGKFLLVNDLGQDRIAIFHADAATAKLTPNDPPYWQARPASGPRHLAFHPNGKWIYNVNELDATVDLLDWDGERGVLTARGFVSTVGPEVPPHTCAPGEITISDDGRFVYVGNRTVESIAVFSVDPKTGSLTLIQLASNGGKNTRHIALDPTGRWLVLSNQTSCDIVVLSRDAATGKLSAPVHTYPHDRPMCVVFA